MKKPEKKPYNYETGARSNEERLKGIGYNQCWDDREKWLKEFLPSEEEIQEIIDNQKILCQRCEGNGRLWADGKAHYPSYSGETILCGNCGGAGSVNNEEDLAKAISKRIRGEK